jgi:hypothetical protein
MAKKQLTPQEVLKLIMDGVSFEEIRAQIPPEFLEDFDRGAAEASSMSGIAKKGKAAGK